MDLQTATQLPLAAGILLAEFKASTNWIEWALGIGVIAIVLVSLYLWAMVFVRLSRNQELIPYQRSACVLGFVDLLVIFVVWLGSQIGVGIALVAISGGELGSEEDLMAKHGVALLYLSAISGIASLVASGVFLWLRYRTTNSFGLRFNQLFKQVWYGILVFTLVFPPMMLLQWLLSLLVEYDHAVLSVLAEDPSFYSIFSCWAAAVIAAPFVEEFLFRGVFQHWLERLSVSKLSNNQFLVGGANIARSDHLRSAPQAIPTAELNQSYAPSASTPDDFNPYQSPYTKVPIPVEEKDQLSNGPKFGYWPIFVSSLCFALVHFGQGLAPIPLFFLALGLGYLFRQTGSLIACITVHFLLNFYSMLVFTIMVLMGETL